LKDILLHIPEGVRDIYNAECEKKNILEEKLSRILKLYGYKDIQTPAFEFFDVFNTDIGTISSKKMYKFFDREGNTLVLRPDITPSIARAVAKYYSDETIPLRFSYLGNTFINNSSYQGFLNETTQMGAELIGDNRSDADGEIIALAIDLLIESGLKDFRLDIGHVDFFKALIEEAHMDLATEEEFRNLIINKNYFGIEDLAEKFHISHELKTILKKLPELFGSADILHQAKLLTANEAALKAIHRLESVYDILGHYGFQKYITFDLGMLSEYNYYTGIIFRGYTYGTGDAVVKGGRYDRLIRQFGKDAASVGFALVIDQLMIALLRQKINIDLKNDTTMILYDKAEQEIAIGLANTLRNHKMNVVMQRKDAQKELEDYIEFGKRHQIGGIFHLINHTTLIIADIFAGTIKEAKVSDINR